MGPFLTEEGVTYPWIKRAGATQPPVRESRLLSYEITHPFEFCFSGVLKLPADLSFPIGSFLRSCYSLPVSASHTPACKGSSSFAPFFLFLIETSNLYLACLESPAFCWWAVPTVTVKKARCQSCSWVPLLFKVHFPSLLHVTASSPEFTLGLVVIFRTQLLVQLRTPSHGELRTVLWRKPYFRNFKNILRIRQEPYMQLDGKLQDFFLIQYQMPFIWSGSQLCGSVLLLTFRKQQNTSNTNISQRGKLPVESPRV